MGLFTRRAQAAAAVECTATVTVGGLTFAANAVGAGRERAMALPTISRARDLLASLIGSLHIRQYGTQWNGEDLEEIPLPPETWMLRPDPSTTRVHTLSWTFDDLFFYGRAHWLIRTRYAAGNFPASFQWLPAANVGVVADAIAGNAPVGPYTLTYNGVELNTADVVSFWSPLQGILTNGARAIVTAEALDRAAYRTALSPLTAGWLKQTGGEPLSAEELTELADAWVAAREGNAIASLNQYVDFVESSASPEKLQHLESRQHQALELARLANIPPYLVGAPASNSMTYQNAAQAAADAVTFGALPFLEVIEGTLSSEQVTPRGRLVRLDRSAWLDNPLNTLTGQTETPVGTGGTP